MPRIVLKPNSAEYADNETIQPDNCICDMPGCRAQAVHKAPKHRALNEYYIFCLEHVKEYNQAWDFFSGMSDKEVEEHIISARFYGERPTWRYDNDGMAEQALRHKVSQTYWGQDGEPAAERKRHQQKQDGNAKPSPEMEALAIMGLQAPVTLDLIKFRYKALAKKHHPDLNPGCKDSEERLKEINMAYTVLRLAYRQYESMMERTG